MHFSLQTAILSALITASSLWVFYRVNKDKWHSKSSASLFSPAKIDKTLRFNSKKEFTILQLTDLHYGVNQTECELTSALQIKLINLVRPDLVVITGDAVSGHEWDKKEQGFYERLWEKFTLPYLQTETKYAFAFGNHDTDADLVAKEIGELDKKHPYSLFNGTDSIDPKSYSNYYLEIKSSFPGKENTTSGLLWVLDSKNKGCMDVPETNGCLTQNQLDWFSQTSAGFRNSDNSSAIQGLAFFHIPLDEFMSLWNSGLTYGFKEEAVCCPAVNTNAFEAFRAAKSVKALFVGHDHNNDYAGDFEGVELVYGRKSGYGSYGPSQGQRGGRVIKLTEFVEEGSGNLDFRLQHLIVQEDESFVEPLPPSWQGWAYPQFKCEF